MMQIKPVYGLGQSAAPGEASARFFDGLFTDLVQAPAEEFVRPGVSAPTMIHVPDQEGEPFGKFFIEWDQSDLVAYQQARNDLINAIKMTLNDDDASVKRLLINANALPSLSPALVPVSRFSGRLSNLLHIYRARVLGKKEKFSKAVIAGGLFIGLAAFAYAIYEHSQNPERI